MKQNDCDNFPDTVIIGLRIEMSVILNALNKNLLIIIIIISVTFVWEQSQPEKKGKMTRLILKFDKMC